MWAVSSQGACEPFHPRTNVRRFIPGRMWTVLSQGECEPFYPMGKWYVHATLCSRLLLTLHIHARSVCVSSLRYSSYAWMRLQWGSRCCRVGVHDSEQPFITPGLITAVLQANLLSARRDYLNIFKWDSMNLITSPFKSHNCKLFLNIPMRR